MTRRYVMGYSFGRQVHQHVAVAEKALGRPLPKGAVVHHANGDPRDNRPENLVICDSAAHHWELHRRERAINAGAPAHFIRCVYCSQYDDPTRMHLKRQGRQGYHRACENIANNARRAKRKVA